MKSGRSVSAFSSKDRDGAGRGAFFEPELNFEKELVTACAKYAYHSFVVHKGVQNNDFYKNLKAQDARKKVVVRKSTTTVSTAVVTDEIKKPDEITGSSSTLFYNDEAAHLVVDALYDNQDELVEIMISRAKYIPRKLMQCIGLLSPYFKYLTKLSIIKSNLDVSTLHELSKTLQMSNLSDVCLDESFLSEANYATLLNETTKLRNLSLSKCRINDDVCEQIAAKLDFAAPAGQTLMLLNLSSNHISDRGAKSLAQALRANRCLRYLSLADNHISDEGAFQLFDVLKEFPLTYDEIQQKRVRYVRYLKEKRAIYMDYFDDDTRSLDDYSRKSTASKRSKASAASTIASTKKSKKAELMSLELLGPFVDPYSPDCTKIKEGWSYCMGNVRLAYLNLAYNRLSYLSLKRIKTMLLYQSGIKIPNSGLMKLVIDGNPFPFCSELDVISQLLVNNVFRAAPDGKRKQSAIVKMTRK